MFLKSVETKRIESFSVDYNSYSVSEPLALVIEPESIPLIRSIYFIDDTTKIFTNQIYSETDFFSLIWILSNK